jgi:Transport and Golgi organisation 2
VCTVSFIAKKRGYLLGMNRDEKRSRPKGLPPSEKTIDDRRVICPSEPGGGTWISLNDSGVTLALINWYSVPLRVPNNPISRGEIIPFTTAESPEVVDIAFSYLPLPRTNAFRLIGIFPQSKQVLEWRWDLSRLVRKAHHWRSQQWISSGFDEPTAQNIRSQTFTEFLTQASAGTSSWLRRLHASHTPERGPFSTCMHRPDAVTVSYTEISVTTREASVRYYPGAPCEESPYSPCINPVKHFARKRTHL